MGWSGLLRCRVLDIGVGIDLEMLFVVVVCLFMMDGWHG